MESFCVEKGDNTAQDIQDLFDLAVWAGADSYEALKGTRKSFEYMCTYDYMFWDFFGVAERGLTFVDGLPCDISDNLITYDQAINHILGECYVPRF